MSSPKQKSLPCSRYVQFFQKTANNTDLPRQLCNVVVDLVSASDLQTVCALVLTKVTVGMVRGVQQGWVPHDLDCDGAQVAGIKGLLQRTHLIQHTSNGPYISLAIIRLALQVVHRRWTKGRQVVDRGHREV